LTLLGLAGCTRHGDVSGKVTFLDQPLNYGSVIFVGEDNLPVSAKINPDGSYAATGVPYGKVRVAVVSPDPSKLLHASKIREAAEMPEKRKRKDLPPPELPPGVDPEKWVEIPARYGDCDRSDLVLTVSAPTATFDIPLKD
jgi:hypothetical protein